MYGFTFTGLVPSVVPITVVSTQGAGIVIEGVAQPGAREQAVRIGAALANSGYQEAMKSKHFEVAFAGTDVLHGRRAEPACDLAIALEILEHLDIVPSTGALAVGELGMDGGLRHVRGASLLRHLTPPCITVLSPEAAGEALAVGLPSASLITASTLKEAVDALVEFDAKYEYAGPMAALPTQCVHRFSDPTDTGVDFSEVAADPVVLRAMTVAAVGGHSVLLTGVPGSGKTMLARRLTTILPPMTLKKQREVMDIQSVAGLLRAPRLPDRPFRAPHHTCSTVGLIGSQKPVMRPGEMTLAHHGVLFLDELPEFHRGTLEAVRDVLRSGEARGYPAKPAMFVAAMNPCPCGYYGSDLRKCECGKQEVQRYMRRISDSGLGFDIKCHVKHQKLDAPKALSSWFIRERVIAARGILCGRKPSVAASIAALDGRVMISKSDLDEAASLAAKPSEMVSVGK